MVLKVRRWAPGPITNPFSAQSSAVSLGTGSNFEPEDLLCSKGSA